MNGKHTLLVAAALLLPALAARNAGGAPSPLAGLDALRGEFPISLRFRSERLDSGGGRHAPPLAEITAAYRTETDGVVKKMLHDTGRYGAESEQGTDSISPSKIRIEHMLFPAVSVEFAKDFGGKWPFSPCHFAYLAGYMATKAPLPGAVELAVADPAKFRKGDAVILLPMRDGRKLWRESEWAAVTAIEGNTLRLKRAVYGSKPLESGGSAYDTLWVAAMPEPYSEDRKTKTQLTWNWSTLCPRDEKGQQASDAFASGLKILFGATGALRDVHGLAWDVPRVSFRPKGISGGRPVDADMDGVGDDGFQNGVNTYAVGAAEMHRKVRAALGEERVYLGDGFYGDDEDPRLQLPGVFNGIEHDINTDHHLLEISSLLNVFEFYKRNVARPQINLLVRKDGNLDRARGGPDAGERRQNQCMKNALATILGIAYSDLSFDRAETGKAFSAADETQCGKEDRLHWLGKPAGQIIRPALDAPDMLAGAGISLSGDFLRRWTPDNADLRREGGNLVISARKADAATPADRDALLFSLNDLPVKKNGGLLVQFEVQSDKLDDFAADVPRILTVTPEGLPGWPEKKRVPKALLGWSTGKEFTPVSFYFREPAADVRIALRFAIQGRQTVRIRNVIVRESTEVFARAFEHGIVLCNPNENTPWTFDLKRLFPGATFRRIDGSDYDREMARENNGERVGASVTVKPQSGLFLVKETPAAR